MIELQRRDHLEGERQLPAHPPDLGPRLIVARLEDLGGAGGAASRFDPDRLFVDGFRRAVHFDQQHRGGPFGRQRTHLQVPRDRLEGVAVDQFDRRRNHPAPDRPRRPPPPLASTLLNDRAQRRLRPAASARAAE